MKNLLIVGGTGRNVGKTECICRLIAKVAPMHDLYALKVSTVLPDEEMFHGRHAGDDCLSGRLAEEFRHTGTKDTIRMLRAGAKRVFYLRSDGVDIKKGFQEFLHTIPAGAAIICESNSLGDIVEPALLLVVKARDGEVKPRALPQLARADLVIISDGQSGFPQLESIEYGMVTGWYLR